ncbi:hypothetical protein [Tateyamaria sp.]|uniref:hypothetical protein n=1 Tax=Tateyamaria sp. TaxID=1929288 RepID=UPI00329D6970
MSGKRDDGEGPAGLSPDKLVKYAREGYEKHRNDHRELLIRRDILLESEHYSNLAVARETIMLSVYAGDMDAAQSLVTRLETAGDPAMGYYVYRELEENQKLDGESYLLSAARCGYLPAQKILALRAARVSCWPNFLALSVARLKHSVKVFIIARENEKDLRLR